MRAWTAAMAMAMVSGCCHNVHLIRIDEFRRLPLREQIAVYAEARRKHCFLEPDTQIMLIADHGIEAADAMTASLKGSGAPFPPGAAITVLELVHFGGVDLRQHEAFKLMQDLARSASDASLRKRASDAVERIARNDPFFGTPWHPPPNPPRPPRWCQSPAATITSPRAATR
jgi:hypothetical protein